MHSPRLLIEHAGEDMRLGAILYVYKGEWGLPSVDFEWPPGTGITIMS